jgi:hypothetical protein
MSEAQFNKAAEIIQGLPKDGALQPSQDDKLYVSRITHASDSVLTMRLVL